MEFRSSGWCRSVHSSDAGRLVVVVVPWCLEVVVVPCLEVCSIAPGGAVHRQLGPQSCLARPRVRTLASSGSDSWPILGTSVPFKSVLPTKTLKVFPMLPRVLLALVNSEL